MHIWVSFPCSLLVMKEMLSCQKKKSEIIVFRLVEKSVLTWFQHATWWKWQSLAFRKKQAWKKSWTPTFPISITSLLWLFQDQFLKVDKKRLSQFSYFYEVCIWHEENDIVQKVVQIQSYSMELVSYNNLWCVGNETDTQSTYIWSWWTMNQAVFVIQSLYRQLYPSYLPKDRFCDELVAHTPYADCDEFVSIMSPCNYSQ